MAGNARLPAIPLIANDPYFSVWCPADRLTDADSIHWSGPRKRLTGEAVIDGARYRFLGLGDAPAMEQADLEVTPTATRARFVAAGASVELRFTTPLLLSDPDVLSTPITFVDLSASSDDGQPHDVALSFSMADELCYDGDARPDLVRDQFTAEKLNVAFVGRRRQAPLSHSGDHITIDWGYAYLASTACVTAAEGGLAVSAEGRAPLSIAAMAAYDDVASIQYFGRLTPAWYARNGKTIVQALHDFGRRRRRLLAACAAFDEKLLADAAAAGGDDYGQIVSAAYRHTIAAHKLIADEHGEMVFLSKENDSNGCIGTVDVSYPSTPLFLLYAPELVRAMCRPVMKFAEMPAWHFDFAPHDVGRYPYATGQVYGVDLPRDWRENGCVYPPLYLYPAEKRMYVHKYQMPVEECGNMLIMLAAACRADKNAELARAHLPTLTRWAGYLIEYGEDPGNQLCTDDFAGHLARNVNLAAKAMVGVAAFGLLLGALGDKARAAEYRDKARAMAQSWLARAASPEGHTHLTFDGIGWSMKYNLAWDRALRLKLLPDSFYDAEIQSYLPRVNRYGLPLDSRADYTKSDWILWTASMAQGEARAALIAPVAKYLRETPTRVPFSDWYDTKTGAYVHFIARSVQGGVFMPLLSDKWA
ncbi:MAG: DUF4965 domain-containing protein [Clostridiales bacterium]|nr:DUF4965 domain-containing protein [Clostridiales bacterium]